LPHRNARAQHLDMSRCWDVANFYPLVVFVGDVRSRCSCSGVWLLARVVRMTPLVLKHFCPSVCHTRASRRNDLRDEHEVCTARYRDNSQHGTLCLCPLPISAAERHYVFRLFVRECVRPGVRPVITISYKQVDGISQNFGWWCSWGDRRTNYILKVEGSRSRSQQGQTFEWVFQRAESSTSTLGRRN